MADRKRVRKAAFQVLRSRPREVAFQVLYQDDLNPGLDAAAGDWLIQSRLDLRGFLEFGRDDLTEDDDQSPIHFNRKGLAEFEPDELVGFAQELVPDFSREELLRLSREELAALVRNDTLRFAGALVAGVRQHRPELDRQIEQAAENWSLGRMAATDRNVLRLGAYELLHTDTPDRVAIDEAVELAKRFGTSQSGPFVNGILNRLMETKV